jgi:hypothetical protein
VLLFFDSRANKLKRKKNQEKMFTLATSITVKLVNEGAVRTINQNPTTPLVILKYFS